MRCVWSLCVGVLATLCIVACIEGGDAKNKMRSVKAALDKTSTWIEFINAAESQGFDCGQSTVAVATCWWFVPGQEFAGTSCEFGIRAKAGFVDGRREGDYEVAFGGC